jgi:ribosome biogenesis GTPase
MSDEQITPKLTELGWSLARAREAGAALANGLTPARVLEHHRDRYVIGGADGDVSAVPLGRSRRDGVPPLERPAVGDWVAVRKSSAVLSVIHAVLPRTSAFVRQSAGERSSAQVVAANVELALIATTVIGDLNPRRLERYATLAWESGAMPIVLLTKCDLATPEEIALARTVVGAAAPGVQIVAISAQSGEGVDDLQRVLTPGSSAVIIGSSGVGKSTLVNLLLGELRLSTQQVRDDGRGRHTTTHRELVRLETGALLIDTPGMRELQLWSDGTGISAAFADVESLAQECRFRDCAHDVEPGCAVRAAVESGALDRARLTSYHTLQREVAWLASRTDVLAAAEAKRRVKVIHRSQYEFLTRRKR